MIVAVRDESWRPPDKEKEIVKRTKLRRKSRTPLAKIKDELWELCKQITRKRYGNRCYTCLKGPLEGSNWQTGHFITDATCSTELSYDLKNLRPQCYSCNINKSGNWVVFETKMIEFEGQEYVDELKRRNYATKGKKYDIIWYQNKIEEYKKILAGLISSSPFRG